jgi:S1-C subfamily serine protease
MPRRRLLLGGGLCWAAGVGAGLPDVIAAARPSVLPLGRLDPLASPRFGFHGSAFVVGDGHLVVTNAHVVPDTAADRSSNWVLQRPLGEGRSELRSLELLVRDAEHDLALLRVAGDALPALTLAADDAVREGQSVAVMGFPIAGVLGFQPVSHRGIVSSIAAIALPAANAGQLGERAVAQLRRGSFDILQLDANAYPGNSGGPVLDADRGDVIGVLNMVLVKGQRESALAQPTGISYAIPVRWVRALLATR